MRTATAALCVLFSAHNVACFSTTIKALTFPKRTCIRYVAFSRSSSLRSAKQEEQTALLDDLTKFPITRPEMHWTVPIQKIGWQDEDGNWFDKDGPRLGPPQNYWRQSMDERLYDQDMELVNNVLINLGDVKATILNLEKKNSARKPCRHRNLLGKWAPILRCGQKVVCENKGSADFGAPIDVPLTIDIFRTAGRKLAPKIVYGTFDAPLGEREEITIRSSDGLVKQICATESNDISILGMAGGSLLQLGGITYLSDYILIQRDQKGLTDVWLRCDDAYLGKNSIVNE
eukprot:CAMPEP_0194326800 /NCGR_PEP_ID=MMETSP0171-20130528/38416_1 /TAXON_ID=218684 /ORGANISM="Corethron pennatum, Strain L29A3" /LENGTH=287 /DNA_ID=CAMNT_0039086529 /DNA_START=95 /DNA_END=958 /DNA_ORIENTATION=+